MRMYDVRLDVRLNCWPNTLRFWSQRALIIEAARIQAKFELRMTP